MYRQQWRQVRHLSETFWARWKKEYLPTLQKRHKWTHESESVSMGDVVLLKEKLKHRTGWPIGRVLEVFPSEDGRVRSVKLRVTSDGQPQDCVRPIVDLVILVRDSGA